MKPKEKAEELVAKMLTTINVCEDCVSIYDAKQCALICIDKMIESVQYVCDLKNGMSKQELEYIGKLFEVKQEINKI